MLKNYFRTACRNLWRNRRFAFINLAGLALGITVFLFLMEYVAFEWSANRYNKNYNNLYRVNVQTKQGDATNISYYVPPGYAPVLQQQTPAIENYVRIADGIAGGVITAADNKEQVFREDYMFYADGSFLDVFSFPLLRGTTSLAEPKTLAISETISRKLFGSIDAVGKIITVSNQFGNTPYTVKAVYQLPENSDINPQVVISLKTLENPSNRDGNDWADPSTTESGFTSIYLQLKQGSNGTNVGKSITSFVRSTNPGSKDDEVFLQPFRELHIAPSFGYAFHTYGSLVVVTLFAGVALLILLIAWVNYINLSTVQSLNRAKEVGVRKVVGAGRNQLVFQFLSETILLTMIAAVIAVALTYLLQSGFNSFTNKPLSLLVLTNDPRFWVAAVLLILTGSLLAGGYVAFVLSGFQPMAVLRGSASTSVKGVAVRKGLVVFQFAISIVFIIATITLYRQLQYMQSRDLGMNLNQLLVVQGPTVSSEDQAERNVAFKQALTQLSFVKKQAASNNVPGIGYNFSADGFTQVNNPQKGDDKKSYNMFICDQNFFSTWGIQLSQGRGFTEQEAERSWNNIRSIIVNEKAAQQLGFNPKENIIGKRVKWGADFEIVGVVKDYHHLSLRETIKPVIYLGSVSYSFFTIQTDASNMQSKIATLRTLFNQHFPGNPFEFFFADDRFAQQYQSEQQLGEVFLSAAVVAIFIACLGLFGLAAFAAHQRTKEIGIRKVLGASVFDLTKLLSNDFVRLVAVAFVIAAPVAWWGANRWLQDFAYRTSVPWWVYAAAGCGALLIAVATVSSQAVKAAMANPVKSLRTE